MNSKKSNAVMNQIIRQAAGVSFHKQKASTKNKAMNDFIRGRAPAKAKEEQSKDDFYELYRWALGDNNDQ